MNGHAQIIGSQTLTQEASLVASKRGVVAGGVRPDQETPFRSTEFGDVQFGDVQFGDDWCVSVAI